MGLIITGYLIGVTAIAMLLINWDYKEENASLTYELLEANRRAVAAEKRLTAAKARQMLPTPQDADPYRGALYAAHARILELERREREVSYVYVVPAGTTLTIQDGSLRTDRRTLPSPSSQSLEGLP